MKRALFALAVLIAAVATISAQANVRLRQDAAKKQIAIEIAGKPFTVYCYGAEFVDKPVFYPVMSPNGARVNREFPMVKDIAGESNDHPHHQSAWFTYDEVNGIHFWNPDTSGRHIEQRDVKIDGSTLTATLAWKDKDGHVVLDETKRVTFGGDAALFWMDHDITLKAAIPVVFGDTKEGAFGLRLNDTLKEAGGSGRYINAEGQETAANVWGKTSTWVAIRGSVKDKDAAKDVTVAIFSHPKSFNSPPYWHARDYGLFAANPFGAHAYDPKAPERATKLAAGESLKLRYRVVIYGSKVEKSRLDQDYAAFAK